MMMPDRNRLAALADYVAAAVAISLPWSTSATSLLVALWVVAVTLTLDYESVRHVSLPQVALFPIALVGLAFAGMLWAHVSWFQRLYGVEPFTKLLVLPLLLIHFSRTDRGDMVIAAFFVSACVLLALSWLIALVPGLPWSAKGYGVPVKDYIIQSGIFTLCFFALLDRALVTWSKSYARSLLLIGLAIIFITNVFFVALARTSLVVIAALLVLIGLRHFERRALATFGITVVALAVVAWSTSPYLRFRVTHLVQELEQTGFNEMDNSSGARIQFWKMSMEIVREAPFVGHGTGSIQAMLAQNAGIQPDAPHAPTNPHNQVLAVAIPLGFVGVLLLVAMWVVHFRMFLLPEPAAWVGLSVVTQNIVGSLFNTHLFDFAQGWLYVFGVGIAGGIVLRKQ
jgi:O-antigen ligase